MECVTPAQHLVLPAGPEAAKVARDFLSRVCCKVHHLEVVEDARLLVSELVGNAVRHGLPPVELQVCCAGGRALEVRVRDGGHDSRPRLDRASLAQVDPDAESGRGLGLVDLLSSDWGTEADASGLTVWFRLVDQPLLAGER